MTDDTQSLGMEHWFWDEQEVTGQGLTVPGGTIALDTMHRRLQVHLDQSRLAGSQMIPVTHWVRFRSADVFGGVTLDTKILVQTPSIVTTPRPIALNPPIGSVFVNPLGDPLPFDASQLASQLVDLLTPQVGITQAQSVAATLSQAFITGRGSLDRTGASALLTLLGSVRGAVNP